MLVITRREGEEVVIGDPANPLGVVRVASIRGDRVRIAFDFPAAIQVHRKEVAQEIVESGGEPGGQTVDQKSAGVACKPAPSDSPAQATVRPATVRPTVRGTDANRHATHRDR